MTRRKSATSQQRRLFDGPPTIRSTSDLVLFHPGPNPGLADFVCQHSIPYDPDDGYDIPAFDQDLPVNKAYQPKAIYDMHLYWSKKHWAVIREYIRHYLPEKFYPKGTGLILDPFCGSGMTGVAALMPGRPVVLIDASPAAAFIAHHYVHPVDPHALESAYYHLLRDPYPTDKQLELAELTGCRIHNLQEELDWLYGTRCDRCGGDAITEYMVYSEQFQCPNCGQVVPLYDCPEVPVEYVTAAGSGKGRRPGRPEKRETKKRRVCPYCYERNRDQSHPSFVISTRTQRFGAMPVLVSYLCQTGCRPKREYRHHQDKNPKKRQYFERDDLMKIKEIESKPIPHAYPTRRMMDTPEGQRVWGVEWRPGRDFQMVGELYTWRNLWALAAIRGAIARRGLREQALFIPLTAGSLILSKMCREATTQTQSGTYYIPQISKALHAGFTYDSKSRLAIEASAATKESYVARDALVSQERNAPLPEVPAHSIDYIFTDPAYADKIQYGELNFVWESWLGFDGRWLEDEIVVNPVRGKTVDDWDRMMRQA